MAETHGPEPYYATKAGALAAIAVIDYTGDNVDNRAIPLGDVYDEVEVTSRDSMATNVDHLVRAHAVFGAGAQSYGIDYNVGASNVMRNTCGAAAATMWQGFGAARDTVVCGSNGISTTGTNRSGFLYRIVARKYRSVR